MSSTKSNKAAFTVKGDVIESAVESARVAWNSAVGTLAERRRTLAVATHGAVTAGMIGKGARWTSQRDYAEQFISPRGGSLAVSEVTLLARLGNGVRLNVSESILGDVSSNGHRSQYKGLESATSATAYTKLARAAHRAMVEAKDAASKSGKDKSGKDKSESQADQNADKGAKIPNGVPAILDHIETLLTNVPAGQTGKSARRLAEIVETIGGLTGIDYMVVPSSATA